MQSDRPDSGNEEFSVRLAWPKPGAAAAPEPEPVADAPAAEEPATPDPAPAADPAPPSPSIPPPPGAPGRTGAPGGPSAPSALGGSSGSAPTGAAGPGAPSSPKPPAHAARPAPKPVAGTEVATRPPSGSSTAVEAVTSGDNRMGRVFVDAFDRLADRLLERLRSLRQDVDADLAAVRSELSSLRQAVDDVGDRVQLRQVKASLDELRADVTGLRRAVLEWPELEQLAIDISAVRGDLAFLYETGLGGGDGMQAPSELLGELQAAVSALGERAHDPSLENPQLAVLAPLVEEVASVRSELTSIRRRMVLRASPLDDEQLEQIVSAVAARVVDELHAGDGGGRRSRRGR
jgi:hypothetical protein